MSDDDTGGRPAATTADPRRSRGLLGLRPTRSAILAGVLTLALGLAISAQIAQTRERGLESLREDELVSVLDTVAQRSARLEEEARVLEAERVRLTDGSAEDAVAGVRQRVGDLGILTGTVPAEGPGVTITISGGDGQVGASHVLDLVQELRDAGAEAIQIGDVRVVASTSFQDRNGAVVVDGRAVGRPLRAVAVGEARTLASALAIPGGVEETVRGLGATIRVDPAERVLVNALHAPSAPRYARAVPPAEGHTTP